MKTKEIKIGGVYSNGKGRVRKVVDKDERCIRGCLQYEIINDGSKKNRTARGCHNMTVQAFAQWAKERVE